MTECYIHYEVVRGTGDFFVSLAGPLPAGTARLRLAGADACLHFGETVWRLPDFPADLLAPLHQRGNLLCAAFDDAGQITAVEITLEEAA